MRTPCSIGVAALVLAASMNVSPVVAAGGVGQLKDLTDALMLLGQPCGAVTKAQRLGKDDHIATCSDGNRYRVYVDQGRVVAEKQKTP